jgi:TolA-binding protein
MQPQEAAALIIELEKQIEAEEALVPKDALLSILGRAYELQGNSEKARATYQRLVTEFPDSAYTMDAQRSLAT